FFFSSRRRHTRFSRDWSSDVCSSDLAELVEAGFPPEQAAGVQAMRGRGCDRCNGSGYKGRVGVFEVMEISDRLRELIVTGAPTAELKQVAMEEGMLTLRQSGLEKVRQGVTSLEEVVRETM